jgi:hypothetical protein
MARLLHPVVFRMRGILPAVLILAACSSPPPAPVPQTSAAAEEPAAASREATAGEQAAGEQTGGSVKTLVVHEAAVELAGRPVSVTMPMAGAAGNALAVAREAGRHLVLRVEGISVSGQPGVYDVHLDGVAGEVGVLSFYGAEEANGQFMAAFSIDAAAARVLQSGTGELRVTFTPHGTATGRARFTRLRLIEE